MIPSEYPAALEFIQAQGYTHLPSRTVSRIVMHCTSGGPNAHQTAAYFASGAEGRHASAHFVVGNDGVIVQCVRLADVAFHAHAANASTIGIENCAHMPGLPPSAAQYAASAQLVAWLCDLYGLPRDRAHIVGHAEADPSTTHTGCPTADGWQWDDFMPLVVAAPVTVAC